MVERRVQIGTWAAAFLFATTIAGCSSLTENHVDCNIVRPQSAAGRSNAEIAQALGVSEADVASCHAPGRADYGEMGAGGGPGMGGAGMGAGAAEGAGGGAGEAGAAGGETQPSP